MDPEIAIRQAVPGDEPALIALGRALTAAMLPLMPAALRPDEETANAWEDEAIRRCFAGGEADREPVLLVACKDGAPVGYALTKLAPGAPGRREARLNSLVVDAGCRGRGIGRALLDAALAEAKRRGAGTIALHVLAGNAAAEKMYRAAGFADERKTLWRTL